MNDFSISVIFEFKKSLACWALLFSCNTSFGLSPSPPIAPGRDLILAGRCEEFAKIAVQTEETKTDRDWVYLWAQSLKILSIPKRLECLGFLSQSLQYRLLIASLQGTGFAPDLQLIDAWRISGGDLNLVRTQTNNLATAVAGGGYASVAALNWLKVHGLKPLPDSDIANEIASASSAIASFRQAGGDKASNSAPTPFEWLLANGYSWPRNPSAAHALLLNLAALPNSKMFETTVNLYEEKGGLSTIIEFDKNDALRPMIYSARTVKAIELLHNKGFNVHAAFIDRKTGKVYLNSALELPNLTPDIQRALLNLKISVAGRSEQGWTSLYAVLSVQPINLEMVELFLKAGAPLHVYQEIRRDGSSYKIDAMHHLAALTPTKISDGQLSKLIQLFVKYGADPNRVQDGASHDLNVGNLPIHTAIHKRLWGSYEERNSTLWPRTFAAWFKESKIQPDVKHPRLKISLISYVLRNSSLLSLDDSSALISSLIELGVPINPEGESLVLETMRKLFAPNRALITRLVELGTDLNQIDTQSGLTVLTHLMNARPYSTNDCFFWMPHHGGSRPECTYETRSERLNLIRWFISIGADPRIKDGNGKSALDLASEFSEADKRESYRDALLGRVR
jgi:hypothetical protein